LAVEKNLHDVHSTKFGVEVEVLPVAVSENLQIGAVVLLVTA
jgi:hypothetical protein